MSVGGSHESPRPPMRRGARIIVVFMALAALGAPMAYIFASFWSVTGQQASATAVERSGVQYLGPLTQLASVLAEAQSTAVRSEDVDMTRLSSALKKMDAANRRAGAALGTDQRWRQLRQSIEEVADKELADQPAFDAYSEVNAQTLALVNSVGTASRLAADPALAGHGTLLRLPEVMVYGAQLADLVVISANSKGKSGATEAFRVALDRIRLAREAVQEGARSSKGAVFARPEGVDALDEFSGALGDLVDTVAPARKGEQLRPDAVADSGSRAREGALALSEQMATDLESRLADKSAELARDRFGVGLAAGLGLLLAAVLLWLSLPGAAERGGPSRATRQSTGEPELGYPPGDLGGTEDSSAASELIDARELLSRDELIRVGRAVRATEGGRDDAFR